MAMEKAAVASKNIRADADDAPGPKAGLKAEDLEAEVSYANNNFLSK